MVPVSVGFDSHADMIGVSQQVPNLPWCQSRSVFSRKLAPHIIKESMTPPISRRARKAFLSRVDKGHASGSLHSHYRVLPRFDSLCKKVRHINKVAYSQNYFTTLIVS
jgi:hypothetical protein